MAGKVIITLDEYRQKQGISKYQIIKNCNVSHTQLNNYCKNRQVNSFNFVIAIVIKLSVTNITVLDYFNVKYLIYSDMKR